MHPKKSQHKGNAKNFSKNQMIQVFCELQQEWQDYSKPLGSKQVIERALYLERLYGMKNVRIVRI